MIVYDYSVLTFGIYRWKLIARALGQVDYYKRIVVGGINISHERLHILRHFGYPHMASLNLGF